MQSDIEAVLDIGSNSVRLFVVRWDGEQAVSLYKDKITCRLMSGLRNGRLREDAIERTAQAVNVLTDRARSLGAQRVLAFGTSAMRDGCNRDVLIERGRAFGVDIKVMSGEEEADLAYSGNEPEGRCGMIDVGGGSTELLAGENGKRLDACSVNTGAVRLFDQLQGQTDAARMVETAKNILKEACERVRGIPVDRWIGVGGTITSLAAMQQELTVYDPEKVENFPLARQDVRLRLDSLCAMTLEQRRNLPGLNPERADIIPFGAAIVTAFFELSQARCIFASDKDNLLGYLEKNRRL